MRGWVASDYQPASHRRLRWFPDAGFTGHPHDEFHARVGTSWMSVMQVTRTIQSTQVAGAMNLLGLTVAAPL